MSKDNDRDQFTFNKDDGDRVAFYATHQDNKYILDIWIGKEGQSILLTREEALKIAAGIKEHIEAQSKEKGQADALL